MEILKSKALDYLMYREYYGLLAWNEIQADRPIDYFSYEWLEGNLNKKEEYLISVIERVDRELSKEHAALLALVLVDFWVIYAAYYLALYFDKNKEYNKAFKYYKMCMHVEKFRNKIKERYNQLDAYLSLGSSSNENYLSKDRIKDFIKFWKDIDNLIGSVNDIYINSGKAISDMDSTFNNIYFYEDLFEYLNQRHDLRFSKILANYISNGEFDKFPFKEELTRNFNKWANGVKKLSSRSRFIVEYSEQYSSYLKNIENKIDDKLLLKEIKDLISYNGYSSIPYIQEKYNIGYNRTFKILEKLAKEGFLKKVKNTYRYIKL